MCAIIVNHKKSYDLWVLTTIIIIFISHLKWWVGFFLILFPQNTHNSEKKNLCHCSKLIKY